MRNGVYVHLVRLVIATCVGIFFGCALIVFNSQLSTRATVQREVTVPESLLPIEAEQIPIDGPKVRYFLTLEEAQHRCPEQRYAFMSPFLEDQDKDDVLYVCVY